MSNTNSNKRLNTLSTFFQYLKGKLTHKEQNAFERDLLNDPFDSDALDGFKDYSDTQIKNDLNSIKNKLSHKGKARHLHFNRKIIAIAATLVFVAGIISILLLFTPQNRPMVSENKAPVNKKENAIIKPIEKKTPPIAQKKETEPKPVTKRVKAEPIQATTIEEEDELVIDDYELDMEEEPESKTLAAKNKSLTIKRFNVEPTNTLESTRKRGASDTLETELFGTLKGEPIIAGTAGYDSSFRTIEGIVRDEFHQPVPGASVNIKGTAHGAISNVDGRYKIKYPSKDSAQPVMASFVGYKPVEMIQNNKANIDFVLEEEYHTLSEVVTIKTSEEDIKKAEEYLAAEPEIGMDDYMDELLNNMKYPSNGSGKKEIVTATIIISSRGHIKDIIIRRSPGEAYSMELIRLVQEGPVWKPATRYGLPVQDEVKIKLRFIPTIDK